MCMYQLHLINGSIIYYTYALIKNKNKRDVSTIAMIPGASIACLSYFVCFHPGSAKRLNAVMQVSGKERQRPSL